MQTGTKKQRITVECEANQPRKIFAPEVRPVGVQQKPEAVQPLEWLTATESAEYLKVKVRTLLGWVRQGKIKGYALSGTKRRIWRFLRADLDAALTGKPMLSCQPPSVLEGRKAM